MLAAPRAVKAQTRRAARSLCRPRCAEGGRAPVLPLPAIRKSRRGCGPAQLEQPSGGGRRANEGRKGREGRLGLAKKRFYALTSGAKEDTGVRGKPRRSGQARQRLWLSVHLPSFFPSSNRNPPGCFSPLFFCPDHATHLVPSFPGRRISKALAHPFGGRRTSGGSRSGGGSPGQTLETGSTPASLPSSGHGLACLPPLWKDFQKGGETPEAGKQDFLSAGLGKGGKGRERGVSGLPNFLLKSGGGMPAKRSPPLQWIPPPG